MILQIHNPNHLPTIHYTNLRDFQGDLKFPIEPQALTKMRNSLMKHGVFVPKFVWFDEAGNANILDGHQTKQGLVSLEADGWEIPPIPYVTVAAASREDAAEKLLQINSEYAKINPQTTWFDTFDNLDKVSLFESIEIPDFDSVAFIQVEEENEEVAITEASFDNGGVVNLPVLKIQVSELEYDALRRAITEVLKGYESPKFV